jgi:hypothetical protein
MSSGNNLIKITILAIGIGLGAPVLVPAGATVAAQSFRFDDARQVISRTQTDLARSVGLLEKNHSDRDRLKNAQKHLSTLDRHFAKGKFDSDTLDSAIGDIQSVLDHNVLHSEDRDTLIRDVTDLRAIRSQHH